MSLLTSQRGGGDGVDRGLYGGGGLVLRLG